MDPGQRCGMRFCRRSGAYSNPVVLNIKAAATWKQQDAPLGSEILRPGCCFEDGKDGIVSNCREAKWN
ncbi:hypothetical protein D3C75_1105460 [compost metagenome]